MGGRGRLLCISTTATVLREAHLMKSRSFKVHAHRAKTKAKAKILLDVCRLFFDLVRVRSSFRLV